MILVDANLLLYAHFASFPQHEAALRWLDAQLNGPIRVGLPWQSLLAFVRIGMNPRVFERPETAAKAWLQIEQWLNCPVVWIPQPTDRHREILGSLVVSHVSHPDLVQDAHLAALAIEHGLLLCSTDGDFARFPGLRWQNPLLPGAR
jgi:toxin-antitoxin system PIN domain toxin